jgi:hypothetical protein
MNYINLTSKQYPLTKRDVKGAFPNTSFPQSFPCPDGYAEVTPKPAPLFDQYTQRFVEVTPQANAQNEYEQTFEIINLTDQELVEGLALKKSDTRYQAEREVQKLIYTQCKASGYDSENSIAKFLVGENDFYEECKALSLWIGKVWTKTISIQTDVENGTIAEPTLDELIAMLPVYV